MKWQPIETAPKDETLILACDASEHEEDFPDSVAVIFWDNLDASNRSKRMGWCNWQIGVDWDCDEWTEYKNPTHWMPVPRHPNAV